MTLAATFLWLGEPTDVELASSWIIANGIGLIWPYVRNYVSTITNLGSVPPLTLYTISVPRPSALGADDLELHEAAPSQRSEPQG